MFIKLHNRIQTHLDEYSGEFITTTGKPPVNANLTSFKLFGKSVQNGTPTPETPILINSVAHDISVTSCGKNLWDARGMFNNLKILDNAGVQFMTFDGRECVQYTTPNAAARAAKFRYGFKQNTRYRIRLKYYFTSATLTGVFFRAVYTDGTALSLYVPIVYNQWGDVNLVTDAVKTIDYISVEWANNVVTYFDLNSFQITEGIAAADYTKYTGTTTKLNLIGTSDAPAEWIGQPISLMSLPDGTADEYRADDNIVYKSIEKITFTGTENWNRWHDIWDKGDYKTFSLDRRSANPPRTNNDKQNIISTKFVGVTKTVGAVKYDNCIFTYFEIGSYNGVIIHIDYHLLGITDWGALTDADRIAYFKNWLENNNLEVLYALQTPIIIPVTPQPTPKSVYAYPNNIFTDSAVRPTISCGVRKLGNRPYIEAKIKDELGNFLVDENGNNIGGLY